MNNNASSDFFPKFLCGQTASEYFFFTKTTISTDIS